MLTLAHRAMPGAASRPKPPVQLITLVGPSTSYDTANGITLDASGNRFVVGTTGSPLKGFIAKLDTNGTLQWQRTLALAAYTMLFDAVTDASGNVYVCGSGRASGSINYGYVAKYNASGVLQWQRKLSGAKSISFRKLAVDSSGDVFAVGDYTDTKTTALLVKYSSGGSIQWQRVISHASNSLTGPTGLSFDASGNLYFGVEHTITPVSDSWNMVIKCNGSGVFQSRYATRVGTSTNRVHGTAVDAVGNIYACGETTTSGVPGIQRPCIYKLNSSGALQWHRWFSGDTSFQFLTGLTLSGDAVHLYAAGTKYLFKFLASDGSLVWQRSLTGPASAAAGFRTAHASGFIYYSSGLQSMPGTDGDALTARLPDDGSGTGTYGSVIVYSESALTSNVGSPTTATPTITDAAGSYTEAAGDMTDAAGPLTATPYL